MAKAEAGNAAQATVYWQKLANSLPADSPALPQVRQMLAELNAPQAAVATTSASSLNIHVAVTVDASIKASIKPDQVLFIYAQALNGPKMPLAIVRKQAAELPLAVDLNDSMAMQPGLHLADFKQLKIIARISKTGNASTQSGDFIGTTELGLPYNEQPVSVTINQEVK